MTKAKKAQSAPKELPPEWEWHYRNSRAGSYIAEKPWSNLRTGDCSTEQEAIEAAHKIEASGENEVADDDMGFHPGFPPGFDPERAAKGLPQEDRERLHNDAIARWRRERTASDSNEERAVPIATPIFLQIPIDQIAPSPTNPRKFFDQGKLQELADSIEAHGLIEPILVRPRPGRDEFDDGLEYQLIAGERRWRASQLVPDMTHIEAKVRDLDDRAVIEIQLVENLQREDVSPIEEADGYMAMLELKNEDGTSVYTVDSLAAKIGKKGKSKSYVYGRLKLRNLPAPALEAIAKGELPATIGELIGRLPSMQMREEFWEDQFGAIGKDWFEMPSFRDIRKTIEHEYMRELKSAPFSRTDGKLIPSVPACKNCPKMTGNNRGDYPDGRADICTDTDCYDQKAKAHAQRELQKAANSGVRVLTPAESEKWFQYGSLANVPLTREYIDLSDECDEAADPEDWEKPTPTYAELLNGSIAPEVVGLDGRGEIHQLVPRAAVEEALAEKGIDIRPVVKNVTSYAESEKKRQEEKKLRQATAAEIVTRALADVDEELFNHDKFLRILATFLIDKGDADTARAIGKRRGLDLNSADVRGSVTAIVPDLVLADVQELIVEWLLQRELEYWASWGSKDNFVLCEYFGLKPEVVQKEVAAKQKSKPKSKAKAVATA